MDLASERKQFVIQIYETLYEQEKAIRRLDLAVLSIFETVKELNQNAAEIYAKHYWDEEQGPIARQHDDILKGISDVIGKLKASMPN
ncbi:MAG: hypothetical protein ABSG54_13460 [Terriglobia bacterium]|jgi:hypothetical protein